MINILSYVGMNMQNEVCLWTLLGLVRTIFDATLFKVNANLKQVWQMSMPAELSMPVQRVLRTMISGIMLVQCFTVYVYLASYIVLLYPVFLEEHPALVLPWLLLAAIRKLLCELTSLAVGLGTCVLLGNAKPPCIKFLILKVASIMPAFYMWLLVYSYYHTLKGAVGYENYPMLPPDDPDYGLELAVRRRRTKSLFTEEHLRKKLVAGFYAERSPPCNTVSSRVLDTTITPVEPNNSGLSIDVLHVNKDVVQPSSRASQRFSSDAGVYEDWFGREIVIPRGDRILEQFITMLLRIGAYLNKDEGQSIKSQMFNSTVSAVWTPCENIEAIATDETETPPNVANSRAHTASYLREYPQIFMKKLSSDTPQNDAKVLNTEGVGTSTKSRHRSELNEIGLSEIEKTISGNSRYNESGMQKSKEIELNVNFDNEQSTTLERPKSELILQCPTSSEQNPNNFLPEIIESCLETVLNSIKSLKSIASASSQDTVLPNMEIGKQRQVFSENSSKLDDENKEAAPANLPATSSDQNNHREMNNTKNIPTSSKKLKKD